MKPKNMQHIEGGRRGYSFCGRKNTERVLALDGPTCPACANSLALENTQLWARYKAAVGAMEDLHLAITGIGSEGLTLWVDESGRLTCEPPEVAQEGAES